MVSRIHSPYVDMDEEPVPTDVWEVTHAAFYSNRRPMLIRARVSDVVLFGRTRKSGTPYYRVQLTSVEYNTVRVCE